MHKCRFIFTFLLLITAAFGLIGGCSDNDSENIPLDIQAIFDKPLYKNSIWGLRVVDFKTGKVLINLRPDYHFFIGSVRKVFSVGELMNAVGAGGVLHGDLILVAASDLTINWLRVLLSGIPR